MRTPPAADTTTLLTLVLFPVEAAALHPRVSQCLVGGQPGLGINLPGISSSSGGSGVVSTASAKLYS